MSDGPPPLFVRVIATIAALRARVKEEQEAARAWDACEKDVTLTPTFVRVAMAKMGLIDCKVLEQNPWLYRNYWYLDIDEPAPPAAPPPLPTIDERPPLTVKAAAKRLNVEEEEQEAAPTLVPLEDICEPAPPAAPPPLPTIDERPPLTVEAAAKRLNVSRATIYRMRQRKEITFTRIGRRIWRISQAEIDRLLTGNKYRFR
jgi:excisionase family DNA binding protein